MTEEKKSEFTLEQQLADFKRQNPKVAEAMELFGISLAKYQETLQALYSPQIYQSTSTNNSLTILPLSRLLIKMISI